MKITKVSCEQFAGARDRMVSFTDGINVIFGKNESGKSTLVNLLFATLFQRAKLDNRSDREFRNLYFPAVKKGRSVVGDFIDGKVTIETDEGTYTLSKVWGVGADCRLSTPDGTIRDPEEVEKLLKEVLVYGRGVYEDLLFTSQSATERALMDLLDPTEKKETKQEIVGAVSRAFAESDGIPMDVIEQAIVDRIAAIEGKHWDADRGAPIHKAGRWSNGLGEILVAYYGWENAADALDGISRAETELLNAVTEYNEKDAAARAAEEAYQQFNTYAGRLAAQGERKKNLDRLARDIAKVAEVLGKWPQLATAVERARALKEEKAYRDALDLQAAVQAERARITPEDLRLAEAACPDADELAQVQRAQRELAMLENKLCGMNLTAAVRTLGGHEVEITSLRTGEAVSLTDGNAAITEAVRITVPGVMEMRLSPADVDVEAVEAQMTDCKETVAAILGKYGAESVEALERHAKAVEAAKLAIEQANNRIARLMGALSMAQLDEMVAAAPATVRDKAAIEAEIAALCGGDVGSFITRNEVLLENYAAEYGSINDLKAKAFDLETERKTTEESAASVEDIPAEYACIPDPDAHLAALQAEMKRRQELRERALTGKTEAASRLDSATADVDGDPVANEEQARRKLEETKAQLAHWKHIYEVFLAQKENVHNNPTQDIADRFLQYLGLISDGRISSDFPEAEKLNMLIYSGDVLLDYGKLSDGTKETVSLAFRLAVLDHLFPDGGGVIVLDDPFNDMDNERVEQSCLLLQECAKRHQVIFLTCREEYLPMLQGNLIRF